MDIRAHPLRQHRPGHRVAVGRLVVGGLGGGAGHDGAPVGRHPRNRDARVPVDRVGPAVGVLHQHLAHHQLLSALQAVARACWSVGEQPMHSRPTGCSSSSSSSGSRSGGGGAPAQPRPCTGCPPPCCSKHRGRLVQVASRQQGQRIHASRLAAIPPSEPHPPPPDRPPPHPLPSTAFCAYSVWNTRPSGLKVPTFRSYCRASKRGRRAWG